MVRKLRVAFGMIDDENLIKGHFGDSKFYYIVDIYEDGKHEIVEKRINEASELEEHESHHGDPNKFKAVISQLPDVDVLAAFVMGPNIKRIREKSDKVPFFTKTTDFNQALQRVKEHFEELYGMVIEKKKKFQEVKGQ